MPEPTTPTLDPSATSTESPADRRPWLGLGLGLLALALMLRNPFVWLRPQLWHEDLIIFLLQKRELGWSAIFQPQAGYLLLYQRLAAAIAGCFPLAFIPWLYTGAALAAWLWVGSLVVRSPLFSSWGWGAAACLAFALTPQNGEVILILTNAQWVLAAGLCLLLAEPPARSASTEQLLYAVIAGLTGPFCAIVMPVAAWRAFRLWRDARRIDPLALIMLACAIIQGLCVILSSTRMQQTGSAEPGRFALGLVLGIFPEFFGTFGTWPQDVWLRLAGGLGGAGALIWLCLSSTAGKMERRRLLLGGGLILLAGVAICLGSGLGVPRAQGNGGRYLFVPFAIFVWAIVALASHARAGSPHRLAALVCLAVGFWHSSNRFRAPDYEVSDWFETARRVEAGETVTISIPPHWVPVTIKP